MVGLSATKSIVARAHCPMLGALQKCGVWRVLVVVDHLACIEEQSLGLPACRCCVARCCCLHRQRSDYTLCLKLVSLVLVSSAGHSAALQLVPVRSLSCCQWGPVCSDGLSCTSCLILASQPSARLQTRTLSCACICTVGKQSSFLSPHLVVWWQRCTS